MIEAILWDNDGVLVDTESLFFAATRDTLARAGQIITREIFIDHVLRSGRNLFDDLLSQGWNAADIAALRQERNALYAERLRAASPLMPGAAETVRALASGYRMAIVTSSLRIHLEIGHRHSAILNLFETVVAREDYERSKPNPEPYLTALARLKLTPDRCIAIEDSERGLVAARAAELRCIIVPNELTRGGAFDAAVCVLPDITQIPRMLAEMNGEPS
ncbi:MAG: HAD family hydrolase [Candidatus Binataceae bacterium]